MFKFSNQLDSSHIETLTRLANTVPCGLYEYRLNDEGKEAFHYLNSKALEIFEISESEIEIFGELIRDMLPQDELLKRDAFNKIARESPSAFFLEAQITTRTNESKWIRMSSLPHKDKINGFIVWSGYILDITKEKEMELQAAHSKTELSIAANKLTYMRELEELNNLLNKTLEERNLLLKSTAAYAKANKMGALISSIAHEINNPLGSILLNAQSLQLELKSIRESGMDESAIETLETIADETIKANNRVANVIKKLRGLFEIGAIEREKLNLSQVVTDVCLLLERELSTNHIQLNKNITPHIHIIGDKSQLQMVILNAVNNAIDALRTYDGQRTIHVDLSENQERITFVVTDNGYGFADGFLQKAFELFQTTKTKGMGIGLWLSRAIIENHNGSISANNLSSGGAILKITLRKTK